MPYQIYVYSAAMQHTSLLKPFMELWCIFVSSKSHKSSCLEIICFLAGESKEGEGRPVGSICSFMQAQEENSGHLAPWQLQRQPYGLAHTHTHNFMYTNVHTDTYTLWESALFPSFSIWQRKLLSLPKFLLGMHTPSQKNHTLIPCWLCNRLPIDARESAMLIRVRMFPQALGN